MSVSRAVMLKAVADALARAAALMTFPVIARMGGAVGYGAYIQIGTAITFLAPLVSLGLTSSTIRFFAAQPWTRALRRRFAQGMLTVSIGGLAGGLTISLLAPFINSYFLRIDGGTAICVWGGFLLFAEASSQLAYELLRSRQQFKTFAIIQMGESSLLVVGILIAGATHHGVVSVLQVAGTTKILSTLVVLMIERGWQLQEVASESQPDLTPPLRSMAKFGMPLVAAGAGAWMMNLGDRLLVGHYQNAKAVGIYASVYGLASLISSTAAPLYFPLYPRVVAQRSMPAAKQIAEIRRFQRFANMSLIPLFVFLVIASEPLLQLLGGAEFRPGVFVAGCVLAAVFINQWNSGARFILIAYDEATFIQNSWLVFGALNIALNLIAVPTYGIQGAALVTLITYAGLERLFYGRASRYVHLGHAYGFSEASVCAALAAISGAVAMTIAAFIGSGVVVPLVGLTVAFWAVYLLTLIGSGQISVTEMRRLIAPQ